MLVFALHQPMEDHAVGGDQDEQHEEQSSQHEHVGAAVARVDGRDDDGDQGFHGKGPRALGRSYLISIGIAKGGMHDSWRSANADY